MFLPQEIWEQILLFTDFRTCIQFKFKKGTKYFYEQLKSQFSNDFIEIIIYLIINNYLDVLECVNEIRFMQCKSFFNDKIARNEYCKFSQSIGIPRKLDSRDFRYIYFNFRRNQTQNVLIAASRRGHLDVIEYLYEKNHNIDLKKAVEGAASNGHLNIAQFCLQKKPNIDLNKAIHLAWSYKMFEIGTFLYGHKIHDEAQKNLYK